MNDRAACGLPLLAARIGQRSGPIATNMYIPALPAVREYFDAGVAEVQATFAVSLVTFAIGILVWGPISDRYGRRTAILSGMTIVIAGAHDRHDGARASAGWFAAAGCRRSARRPASPLRARS